MLLLFFWVSEISSKHLCITHHTWGGGGIGFGAEGTPFRPLDRRIRSTPQTMQPLKAIDRT